MIISTRQQLNVFGENASWRNMSSRSASGSAPSTCLRNARELALAIALAIALVLVLALDLALVLALESSFGGSFGIGYADAWNSSWTVPYASRIEPGMPRPM